MSAVDRIRMWRADPRLFVRQCLGAVPDAWQDEVLLALVNARDSQGKPIDRLALKASKGPGKSTLLAWAVWWFLVTHSHPKVVATSISGDNLEDNLWSELSKWQRRSQLLLNTFTWTQDRVYANDHPETWWASARKWEKGSDPGKQADTLAGIHADNVMFVLDEAGGIPDAVAAAAEGGLANESKEANRVAKLLIAGNPTLLSGPLYRACTTERSLWWVKEISGDPDDPKRAPRVSIDWARAQIAKYGRDNPFVLVNVFGKFPPSSSNALLGPDDVSAAIAKSWPLASYASEVKILGVDVARFGDDRTVFAMRQGQVIYQPVILRNQDLMQTAAQVAHVYNRHKPAAIFVDVGMGAGVIDRLRELGYPAQEVNFGGKPVHDPMRYFNRRTEMWDLLAQWIKEGGAIPNLPELQQELVAPLYKFTPSGKMALESKDEIKKRLGFSPDIADAMALTFAAPVASFDVRNDASAGLQTHREAVEYDPLQGE